MQCIFCKKSSHTSKSEEHIIPESIGSKRVVLPPGIVCDQCNNYFARKVEAPILNHPSFKNIRAHYRVPSKRGKSPPLSGYIAGTDIGVKLQISKEGTVQIQPES